MDLHDLRDLFLLSRRFIEVTEIRALVSGVDFPGKQRFQDRRELGNLIGPGHGIDHQHTIALKQGSVSFTERGCGSLQHGTALAPIPKG